MATLSNVYRIRGAFVTRTNEDGNFDTAIDDFTVLAADADTAIATATTYIGNLFPANLAIVITDGATVAVQNVITAP